MGFPQQQPVMMMPGSQPPPPVRWPAPSYPAPRQAPPVQLAGPRPAAPRQMPTARSENSLPAPVVRGVPREDISLSMPAPESLNIRSAREKLAVDWAQVRGQLSRVGATGFQLEMLPQGGFRFLCQVPDSNNRPQQVEGRGTDEAEAIERCLAQIRR